MTRTDVLIVGAGPSGLVMALWLVKQGLAVRIIDKAEVNIATSRALVIHARTLELYRQLDIAEEIVASGHKLTATNIWSEGIHRGRIPIGDAGSGLTPYPFIHILSQDRHEKLLEKRLNSLGVHVERYRELLDFTEHDAHVTARIKVTEEKDLGRTPASNDKIETCEATFIAGCDGAHSAVRHTCGIGFDGAMYSHVFFVADIEGTGPSVNGDAHVTFNHKDFILLFPYDNNSRVRISGAVSEEIAKKETSEIKFEDIDRNAIKTLHLDVGKVNWFTAYRVHHRVAAAFRKGRAFLIGDAAHIHSPVGGQGMNTGIGDAINLAWKLAAVIRGQADLSLLDTYEAERRAFATTLVETTDSGFNVAVSQSYLARFMRTWFIPYVAPWLVKIETLRHRVFERTSQLGLNYRNMALSAGSAGYVQGGDRVPWAPIGDVDNFESLKAISWQVHVYGTARQELDDWCQAKKIPLQVFSWDNKYHSVGLKSDAAYLIRPDSYVAVAEPSGLPQRFDRFFHDIDLRLA
ncbi:hypothetical protein ARAM_000124 [Aspergillus rambellii]|uniref:FAD-binding domain-containing protein n=1 Tax=Aspergillus rambellii TaxID=308745 RepID=A0A0F8X5H1_9EURO|nr:hypothetical protein ARAM_000124 [Aspergillus rambellii]